MEFPVRFGARLPKDWIRRSSTKAVVRVHTPYLINLVRQYQETLETRTNILNSLFARTLARFDTVYDACWMKAIRCVADLDGLACLAKVSGPMGVLGETRCRPQFVEPTDGRSVFRVESLRHPCLMAHTANDFIPNDICK